MNLFLDDLNPTWLALIAFLFLYLTYYFSDHLPYLKTLYQRGQDDATAQAKWIYTRRTVGLLLLGVIPLMMLVISGASLSNYGLGLPQHPLLIWWVLIPSVLLIGGSLLRPSSRIDLSYYPEVRKTSWSPSHMIINGGFWIVYLLGYEFGLRGYLFFSLVTTYGLISAVILNSVLYSMMHIFKGPQEAFGAFFLGVLFALMTYYTQSIWLAFMIHVMMAIINDQKAIAMTQRKRIHESLRQGKVNP